jgi:hypothetical protein
MSLTYLPYPPQVNERHCIFAAFAVSLCAFGDNTATYKGHMTTIPGFTESHIWTMTDTLKAYFKGDFVIFKTGKSRLLAQADHELREQEEAGNAQACYYGITTTRNQLKPTLKR